MGQIVIGVCFSRSDKDLVNQERSLAIQREAGFRSLKNREVSTDKTQKNVFVQVPSSGKMSLRSRIMSSDSFLRSCLSVDLTSSM